MTKKMLKREAWKAAVAILKREIPEWDSLSDGDWERWEKAWSEVIKSVCRLGQV